MKKTLSLLLVTVLLCSFAACGKGGADPSQEEQTAVSEAPQEAEGQGAAGETAATMPPESETVKKAENAPEGENRFTFSGISMILPEGFEVSNAPDAVMAYAKDGPERGDVINFVRGDAIDASIYTKELMDESLKQNLSGYTGMKRYESGTVGDTDSILMGYDIATDGITFHITQVLLFYPDRSLSLTFNDVSGKYAQDFEKSIKSIKKEQ